MKEDPFIRHELLDRAELARANVDDWLLGNPHLRPDEQKLAELAHQALFDLYQLIGRREL